MDKNVQYYMMDIAELIPYARNARTHSEKQIAQIAASIKEFGFLSPLVIAKDNTILCGHGRFYAAQKLGIKKLPCVREEYLTEAQRRAFVIADNKLALNAGWDEDLLTVELQDLQGMEFDIGLTGFDEKELADLFAVNDEPEEDEFDEEAALQAEPFVKKGDLWLLGKHRLLCGDSTKADDVALLMDGNKANVCITDPPYACNYTGGTGMKIMNDNLKGEEFYQFLLSAFKNAYDNLADGAAIYIFHSDAEKVKFYNATIAAGFHYSTTCIWVKQSLVLGRFDYQMRHEPIIYAFKDTVKHKFYGDRKQTTVWEFDRPSKSKLHPTTKPLPLIAYPMKNSSLVNSIVLDLFGGSGSTLIAAEQLERMAYLMELDPVYASAIVRRFVAYQGNTDNISVIRDGKKLACSEVYTPTDEDMAIRDAHVNDAQKRRKEG